jgi:hypothetical protein
MSFAEEHIFSVAEINAIVREMLEGEFSAVAIAGEVSNLRVPGPATSTCRSAPRSRRCGLATRAASISNSDGAGHAETDTLRRAGQLLMVALASSRRGDSSARCGF